MRMIKRLYIVRIIIFLCFGTIGVWNVAEMIQAKESMEKIEGKLYEFEEDSHYEFSSSGAAGKVSNNSLGTFSISGNVKLMKNAYGTTTYEILDGNVEFLYSVKDLFTKASEEQWHLTEDETKAVNTEKLENHILNGSLIIQTSLTGRDWITDSIYTDIASDQSSFTEKFYQTKNIQQINGCFYRVIVAYELEKKLPDKKILFANIDEYDHKKCAEVYDFYLINQSEDSSGQTSSDTEPRKELGTKINTGKDNGFSGNHVITAKDPHYGWDIGTFIINGYTRETEDTVGNPVFLKNVGDRVTLWFDLKQDIKCLNGNSKLSISEDINGYDQYFELEKSNFKHGALIIRYTDHEGVKHDPVIYTDYLAASVSKGTNTKVELFEEGDYEVALDYEIKDSSGMGTYTNYRIFFTFLIRNGNCMVYPFDVTSGAELSDGAITENGFKLDMAKSRYLTIDVQRSTITSTAGIYNEDVRVNGSAKDGEEYVEEGIYKFTVKNLYASGEPTTKIIYVGNSPALKALSLNHMTVQELNEQLARGAELSNDGTLVFPLSEEEKSEEDPVIEETDEIIDSVPEHVEETTEAEQELSNEILAETVSASYDWKEKVIYAIAGIALVLIVSIALTKVYTKKHMRNE